MKVSKEKKKEIRINLLKAAVDVFTEKGFRAATMREISTRAGYGAATIYNYFPSKEKILYAYFDVKLNEINDIVTNIPEINEFTLKEKLQIQIETILDIYLSDREFVAEAYQMLFDSPLKTFSEFASLRTILADTVKLFLESAVEKNEIPAISYERFILTLYDDYCIFIVMYWLRDDSDDFSNTSQFIDMSLDLIIAVLKSNIITKLTDILVFLLKSHIYGSIDNIHTLFSSVKEFHEKYLMDEE